MEDIHTLFISKGSGNAISTYGQWGIVCIKVPFKAGGESKELPANDWPDEHGEDTYIPSKLMLNAYYAEFEMAYKGEELATNPFDLSLASSRITAFKKWLTGNDTDNGSGAELKIYSPFSVIGRQGCYLKEISDEDPVLMLKQNGNNLYNENVVTFKVTFKVTDPVTDVILSV